MTPEKSDTLREWDTLTVEAAFWRAVVQEPAFRQVQRAARGNARAREDVSVTPDALRAARERLRLPERFDDSLLSLLESRAPDRVGELPPGYRPRWTGEWVPQLKVSFTIDYVDYPTMPDKLQAARTLTEARRKARLLSERIVTAQWGQLGLPDRPRRRNVSGELATAGRRLAEHFVGGRTYAIIAIKEEVTVDTVKKSVQLAAQALGINLPRRRSPIRAPR